MPLPRVNSLLSSSINTKQVSILTHESIMAFQKSLWFLMAISIASISSSHAYTFQVGGKDGWTLHPSESYNNWAARLRFLINDTLHFKYDGSSDSVLVVNKGDYDGCNTNNPITKLDGGDSTFKFNRSGPFYFITGNKSNCDQGQKLTVVVLALRNQSPPPSAATPPTFPPSPAVSPVIPPSPSTASPVSPPPGTPGLTPQASVPPSPSTTSPVSPPPGTPGSTPEASSPDGGQSSGGNNPSADTTSPPPLSAAAPPLSGVIIASAVTIIFALLGVY
ncbi:hypothetical protein L1987_02338 [Smallanthus sonchifolius]|uniref:Uncharacterized protein n=1 Tax=Smallanthus sonchifolius TaxID=185202 RepID=A0ACB9K7F5_9ASTR|nr:hypothetical protein L1987_02338 [Smallanthus sonchifolius]